MDLDELKKVLKYIREIHSNLADDSILAVAFTGRTVTNSSVNFLSADESSNLNLNDLARGRCFLKLKNDEIDKLELDVKELYDKCYPNGKTDNLGVILPDSE